MSTKTARSVCNYPYCPTECNVTKYPCCTGACALDNCHNYNNCDLFLLDFATNPKQLFDVTSRIELITSKIKDINNFLEKYPNITVGERWALRIELDSYEDKLNDLIDEEFMIKKNMRDNAVKEIRRKLND